MKPRYYALLSRAIEEGVAYGWRRAHKHTEKPDVTDVQTAIEDAVMSAVCEIFDFDFDAQPEN